MELNQIQATLISNSVDRCQIFVDKQPDRLDERWQKTDDGNGMVGRNIARRSLKKDEAESISSGFDRHQCIFPVGYAADFDFDHIVIN